MLKRRLYLQIYLTIVASLIIVVVLSGLLWSLIGRDDLNHEAFRIAGRLAYATLPAADAPVDIQSRAIDRLGEELDIDFSLFDRHRNLIAANGIASPAPAEDADRRGWHRLQRGRAWMLSLPDGRWLVIDLGRRGIHFHFPLLRFALFLGVVALGVGLGAYPFVRRLTRRLEQLQSGVERIGAGDLAARVDVRGHDEVASLAQSFNAAAEKIEKLVDAHRMLLANASHELRTPLSRIRLGIEMLKDGAASDRKSALQQDIAELDQLIDEILLMSRLDAQSDVNLSHEVDLVALAAEECARYPGCMLSGTALGVAGDPRLLRRLIRNLLENAHRHGKPPVEVIITHVQDSVTLTVRDAGSGIPGAEREKVFQPFYRSSDRQNVKGYGLGLPLVRQIAELHGGSVTISQEQQPGCAVTVTLRTVAK